MEIKKNKSVGKLIIKSIISFELRYSLFMKNIADC